MIHGLFLPRQQHQLMEAQLINMRYIISIAALFLFATLSFAATPSFIGLAGSGGVGGAPSSITDDFNRSNGALGTNWTSLSAGQYASATTTINTNKVVSTSSGNRAASIYTGASINSDQYAQATLGTAAALYIGVFTRMDANGNGYLAQCTNLTVCSIAKVTSGTAATIGATITVSSWTGQTLKLTSSGSTHTLYLDGSEVGSRTDSSYSSGYAGILISANSATYGIDNFEAGNL